MTICIFTAFYPPHLGGVERYVSELSDSLADLGHKIIIVTSENKEIHKSHSERSEESDMNTSCGFFTPLRSVHNDAEVQATYANIENENKIVFYLPVFGFLSVRFPIPKPSLRFFKILKAINKTAPDIFIVNMRVYLHSLVGAIIGKKIKKPVILIEHLSGSPSLGYKFMNLIWRIYEYNITAILKLLVDKYYGVSKAATHWLEKFNIEADGVVYNGISGPFTPLRYAQNDASEELPDNQRLIINDEPTTINCVYAGRLIEEKGILTLIEAFRRLASSGVTTDGTSSKDSTDLKDGIFQILHLYIAGDGPLLNKIKSDISSFNNITMLGKITHDEVMTLLKKCDIAIIPSKYPEGLPTLILEAGASGCAVISTDVGGATEIITSEDYGIIIKPDSADDIINAIRKLAVNTEYRKRISVNLMEKVAKEFNWNDIARYLYYELVRLVK